MIKIKEIQVEDTFPLRIDGLRKNIDLPYVFDGDYNDTTFHFGLFLNQKLICVVSFIKSNFRNLCGLQYQLRGMVTKSEYQGKGYGKQLIIFCENKLSNIKVDYIWCNARIKAVPFYLNLEYKKIDKEFFIPQIGSHFVMYKKLDNKA